MTRRRIIRFLVLPVLLLTAGWTVYAEVYTFRMTRLLEEVRTAEETTPFQGEQVVRLSPEKESKAEIVFQVWSDPPHRHCRKFKEVRRDGKKAHRDRHRDHGGQKEDGAPRSDRRPGMRRGGPRNFEALAGRAMELLTRTLQGEPDRRSIMLFHDIEHLMENYDVRLDKPQKKAGRDADCLRVSSRHPGRSGYRLWVDRENRFPLGMTVLDSEGRTRFETRFTAIRFHPEFSGDAFSGNDRRLPGFPNIPAKREALSIRDAAAKVAFPAWEIAALPEGMKILRSERISGTVPLFSPGRRGSLPTGDEKEGEGPDVALPGMGIPFDVLHELYSDGAARASFLQTNAEHPIWKMLKPALEKEEAVKKKKAEGKLRVYRLFRHGRGAMIAEREKTLIIVAGNLPERELLDMIRNMRRVP